MQAPVETTSPATVFLPVSLQPQIGEHFESAVRGILQSGARQLLLDCSLLEHLYSGHVRLMWTARELCNQHGATLQLVSVRPDIIRILRLLDLLEFFPFKVSDRDQGYADAVAPSGEAVREAMGRFTTYLSYIGVPEAVATDARTIFFEIASNILHHGCLDATEVIIVTALVSGTDSERELVMRFTDNGIPFDSTQPKPRLVPEDAAAQRQMRGFGLMMVERLADSFTYERYRSTFNVLTAKKRWSI